MLRRPRKTAQTYRVAAQKWERLFVERGKDVRVHTHNRRPGLMTRLPSAKTMQMSKILQDFVLPTESFQTERTSKLPAKFVGSRFGFSPMQLEVGFPSELTR